MKKFAFDLYFKVNYNKLGEILNSCIKDNHKIVRLVSKNNIYLADIQVNTKKVKIIFEIAQ